MGIGMEINLVKGAYIDGAFMHVKTPNTGIVLDFGVELQNIFSDAGKFRQPKLPLPMEELKKLKVDYVIITHGHFDHCGGYGLIKILWPNARILMTRPTFYFTNILCYDAICVAEKNKVKPLFGEEDLTRTNEMVEIIENSSWFKLGDVLMRCPPSGHIRGANSVIINYKGKNLMYSADICFWDQPTVLGADMRLDEKIDLLIMDATNGTEIFPNQDAEYDSAAESAKKTIGNDGVVFSPTFAVGRSTDVTINYLNHGIKMVDIDGMARDTYYISRHPEKGWWEKTININYYGNSSVHPIQNRFEREEEEIHGRKKSCIVSTAGVGEFGPAASYIPKIGREPKNSIQVFGHMFEGSPTQQLFNIDNLDSDDMENLKTGRTIKIRGEEHIIRAQVEHFQISSHADQKGALKFVGRNRPKRVVFTHSSKQAKNCLIEKLRNSPIKAEAAKNGMKLEL
jgi:Cft2 family RNA processing exonuclease